ncbi:MAG: NADH-quinone oxidoreductase subunit C [Endomicrobia bacterium]|nr:NADH-quinone oxidoreductase subunit C [Endomicrobiia bacterium]MCL2799243.1 NADH-quinone oxidoreductase subunit C [Endomicrobiia bacterium]
MENNHPIVERIAAKYPELAGNIKVQSQNRLWMKIPYSDFRKFLEFAVTGLKINVFCMLTGLDDKENFSFIYHMADLNGLILNIETSVPKTNASIVTITDMYPAAELQEREITDLFGVAIEGLPEGHRYPLPDNWPEGEYPLRKDWTQDRLNKNPLKEKTEDCNA